MAAFDAYLVWGIAVLIIAVALIAALFMRHNRKKSGYKEDDALQTLGATLVILGIIFGEDRFVGYSFIGAGVLLSVISLVIRRRQVRT